MAKKPLTDAQVKALDRDKDGEAGGSISRMFQISDAGVLSVTEAWRRDDTSTLMRLQLVMSRLPEGATDLIATEYFGPTLDWLATADDLQIQEIDCWAYACHLAASDNDGVQVPALPVLLEEFFPGDGDEAEPAAEPPAPEPSPEPTADAAEPEPEAPAPEVVAEGEGAPAAATDEAAVQPEAPAEAGPAEASAEGAAPATPTEALNEEFQDEDEPVNAELANDRAPPQDGHGRPAGGLRAGDVDPAMIELLGDMASSRYGVYAFPPKGFALEDTGGAAMHDAALVRFCIDEGYAFFEPSGGRHGSAKITELGRDFYKRARQTETAVA